MLLFSSIFLSFFIVALSFFFVMSRKTSSGDFRADKYASLFHKILKSYSLALILNILCFLYLIGELYTIFYQTAPIIVFVIGSVFITSAVSFLFSKHFVIRSISLSFIALSSILIKEISIYEFSWIIRYFVMLFLIIFNLLNCVVLIQPYLFLRLYYHFIESKSWAKVFLGMCFISQQIVLLVALSLGL